MITESGAATARETSAGAAAPKALGIISAKAKSTIVEKRMAAGRP